MVEVLTALYLVIGLIVFNKSLKYFDEKNGDGDPEGLDALVSLGAGCFWPVVIPLVLIYHVFRR